MRKICRRSFLRQAAAGSAAGALGLFCRPITGRTDENRGRSDVGVGAREVDSRTLEKARRIHQRVLTIDSHVDIDGEQYATEQLDPGVDNPHLKCDLVKMAAGGVDGVFLAVYTGQGPRDAEAYGSVHAKAMGLLEAIRRLPRMYADRCELATSPDDVERIVDSGKRAIMIGMENGYPLGTDPANVEKFYNLGVRYITLSHNGHNQICDSCNPRADLGDEPVEHGGLSPFGRKVVAEMNRLGIMVDVSHIAPSSFRDVIAFSRAPIIASHSGCRGVFDHPRNLDDHQLRALAANGGVIQVVAVPEFLKGNTGGRREEPVATIEDYIDHIDHAVRVAGVEHVGIGSDFDGGGGVPGFDSHADSLNVTVALVQRGYSEDDIRSIWGGNLLRVWREVERERS